jgi:DNA-binding response OmpR family regulator
MVEKGNGLLLVGRDTDRRELLAALLGARGFELEAAASETAAVDRLIEGGIDVVVIDINPHHEGSFALLRTIRQGAEPVAEIPVVFSSERSKPVDRLRAWEQGADGWVPRPHHIEELVTAIRDARGRSWKQREQYRQDQFEATRRAIAESKRVDR